MSSRASTTARLALAIAVAALGRPHASRGGARPAAERTVPGQLVIHEPTLVCLGFEWRIEGDSDGDCSVAVSYRRALLRQGYGGQRRPKLRRSEGGHGESTEWLDALPLFRVENVAYRNQYSRGRNKGKPFFTHIDAPVHFGNKLAGSIFDLEPDTEYEVRLRLADPDGGEAERTVTARTRAIPKASERGRTVHVAPGERGGAGTRRDPFRGLAAADAASRPGDVVLLHEGVYRGLFRPTKDGAPGRPIVWRGTSADGVILDGAGLAKDRDRPIVDLRRRRFVFLENLTVRNGEWGAELDEGEDLVVRRCVFRDVNYCIAAWSPVSYGRRFLISDNVILGQLKWGMGHGPKAGRHLRGGEAIVPTGDGHVICHNYIRGFSDGISLGSLHTWPDGRKEFAPNSAVDIYGNDIVECLDDGIELDSARSNVRAFRNRVTNALKGLSCQPVFGGPVYMIRNELVNVQSAFKFHCEPSGMVIYHNTCLAADGWVLGDWANAVTRNNIIVAARPGARWAIRTNAHTRYDLDYDGLCPVAVSLGRSYDTFDAFRRATGQELHATALSPSAFARWRALEFSRMCQPGEIETALDPGGRAVDRGERLANVNDDFTGEAPDLGCHEVGRRRPHYGPRR